MGKKETLIKNIEKELANRGLCAQDYRMYRDIHQRLLLDYDQLKATILTRDSEKIHWAIGEMMIWLIAYERSVPLSETSLYYSFKCYDEPTHSYMIDKEQLQKINESLDLERYKYVDMEKLSAAIVEIGRNHGYVSYDYLKPVYDAWLSSDQD